jgi:putative ABC transport system permease protein
MDGMLQDVRHGLRGLRRRPGFAAAAVLTLALGIGANAAVFTLVDAVLLRPLPYGDPGRLVRVWGERPSRGLARANCSPQDFLDWRQQARSFAGLAAFASGGATLDSGAGPLRVPVLHVTHDLLDLLGVRPALGRGFRREEDAPGGAGVVLLSHAAWRDQLGADPEVLGRSVRLDDQPATVVGVLPAGFRPPLYSGDVETPAALLRPLGIGPENGRGGHWVSVVGRLAAGATTASAQAEMDAIAARLERQYPATNAGWTARLEPLHGATVGRARAPLGMLAAAVALVLLVACANLSSLLLMRAAERGHEIAVRAALGASRLRIGRQLLTESLLLGLLGGAAGLLLARWLTRSFVALAGDSLPRAADVAVDARTAGFLLAASLGCGALIGVLPALRAAGGLAGWGSCSTASPRRSGLRDALVVAETALALLLAVGAALAGRSLRNLDSEEAGFRRRSVLAADLSLPAGRYGAPDRSARFYADLLADLERHPAATAAGAVSMIPLGGSYSCDGFGIDGRPWPAGAEECAEVRIAAGGYFRAMGIPILRGRALDGRDGPGAPAVALINETMARRFWPGRDPVGLRITYDTSREIVGVVGDVRHFGLDRPAAPEIYLPHAQVPVLDLTLAVAGDPEAVLPALRAGVRGLDAALPLGAVRTTADLVAGSTAPFRFRSQLLGGFAAVALGLAMVGLYGVLAYAVAGRAREIGVRVALGARPADVLRDVVGRGMALALGGVALGLAAALAIGPLLAGMLHGVRPADPPTLAAMAAVLLVTAAAAALLPGRRAARVDPAVVLRHE